MNARWVKTLVAYAENAYTKRQFSEAMKYTHKAIELSEKLENKTVFGQIYLLKGKILNSQGKYAQDNDLMEGAVSCFEQAEQHSYSVNPAEIYLQYGHVYFNQKNYDAAYKSYHIALANAEKTENLPIILKSMTAISRVEVALKKFKSALEIAEKIQFFLEEEINPAIEVECREQFLMACLRMGKFSEISKYAPKALKLAQKIGDVENEAKILNVFAISFAKKGEYKAAFDHLVQSKLISETIGFHEYTAKSLINISNIYSALSNQKESYQNLNKLLSTPELLNAIDDYTKGILYYNYACITYSINREKEGIEYLFKAQKLGKAYNNVRLIARAQYELMRIHLEQGRIDEALKLAQITEKFHKDLGEGQGSESHHANIAEANFIQKNYDKAIQYALKAVTQANKVQNHKTRKRSYKILAQIYKAKNDFANAYNYLELYSEASEFFFKEMRRRSMIDLEMKYEIKEKEKEIELLKSKMEYQKLELKHAHQLAERNQKIAEAQEDIKQFTYAVSHDLKEPLRMIGSFSKLLFRKYAPNADEADLDYFNYISGGVARMTALLNGLLEYGRLGKHQNNEEWINLQEMMEEILITLFVKIKESEAQVTFNTMPTMFSNRMMVFQLLQNLVANAVKFKRKGIAPEVIIEYKETSNEHLFSIKDNGIGIPEEQQERIFKIFARLHRKDEYEGTGVGLAMCRKIVTYLKGEIHLTSTVGEGTTFFIQFPKAEIPEEIMND